MVLLIIFIYAQWITVSNTLNTHIHTNSRCFWCTHMVYMDWIKTLPYEYYQFINWSNAVWCMDVCIRSRVYNYLCWILGIMKYLERIDFFIYLMSFSFVFLTILVVICFLFLFCFCISLICVFISDKLYFPYITLIILYFIYILYMFFLFCECVMCICVSYYPRKITHTHTLQHTHSWFRKRPLITK